MNRQTNHDVLYNDDVTEIYDYWVGNGYYDYPELAKAIAGVAPKGSKILEIGIGTGSAAIPLLNLRRGYSVSGIDQSPFMLQKLQEKLDKERLEIDYYQQSAEEINLNSKYDVIFSVGGPFWIAMIDSKPYLHSYVDKQNLPSVLKKLNSLLNTGGSLMINIQKHGKAFENKLKNGMDYKFSVIPQGDDYILKTHYFYKGEKLMLKQPYKMPQLDENSTVKMLTNADFSTPRTDKNDMFWIVKSNN